MPVVNDQNILFSDITNTEMGINTCIKVGEFTSTIFGVGVYNAKKVLKGLENI